MEKYYWIQLHITQKWISTPETEPTNYGHFEKCDEWGDPEIAVKEDGWWAICGDEQGYRLDEVRVIGEVAPYAPIQS